MAFEGLRARLRTLAAEADDADERAREDVPVSVRRGGRRVASGVAERAPATGLEGTRRPKPPRSTRELMARRLQESGKMRKPIGDANLKPGADPRFLEAFAMGDATTGFAWFGEHEADARGDAMATFFASEGEPVFEFGPFVDEMLDERDHEAGHYAYDDERETGWLDDGVPVDDIVRWP